MRRLNQRITLAINKIKISTPGPLLSLGTVSLTKSAIQKYMLIITNNRKRSYFFSAAASASQIRLLNQLSSGYVLLRFLESGLIVIVISTISNAIFQSYSNNKY